MSDQINMDAERKTASIDTDEFVTLVDRYALDRWVQGGNWKVSLDALIAHIDGRTAGTGVPEKLAQWASLTEEMDTDWLKGYEAARSYVRMQLASDPTISKIANFPVD